MRLSYTTYRLNCIHPFGISRSTNNYYDRVFIYLEQDGIIGRGEAAPSERYGESVPIILDRLQDEFILPKNVENIDKVLKLLNDYTGDIKALRSAFVNALIDWWTQKNNITVAEFFNFSNKITQPTSYTIAIGDLYELPKKIAEAERYNILKVKLGTVDDKKIISAIRKISEKPIRIDANEGWDIEIAMEMVNWLLDKKIELIEQPLAVNDMDNMIKLKNVCSIPLIADENCLNSADIEKIVDAFDGINIKLAKCGGIDEAGKMIELAKKFEMKIMLGCMVESSVGITALGHFAAEADYLDLDGNVLIDNDPYSGLEIVNSIPVLPNRIGMGLTLKDNYKNKYSDLK